MWPFNNSNRPKATPSWYRLILQSNSIFLLRYLATEDIINFKGLKKIPLLTLSAHILKTGMIQPGP